MKIPTRSDNFFWTSAMLCLAIGLTGCAKMTQDHRKNSQIMQTSMTLWQTIDALAQHIPFSKNNVENVLSAHLAEKDTSESPIQNTAFLFYIGGPVNLTDGAVISNVDLRIRRKAGHPGFLVLNMKGRCVSLDEVRSHYSDLKLTYPPRPDSTYAFTGYSTFPSWGRLSFSFLERNPNCLSSLSFDPKPIEAGNMMK
ncbi:hypothetical protein [Burkholderia sp. Ax-1724]|uniref:hypothetical protein n=1 Tax=Burkholderia sp. Ax-1724 TaxID=2608336 RepID=UPI001F038C12|nr:hypothetical protein [Burkholderia sp. Ax-1724]